MNKKILMVGVLDVPSSTNVAMKKGFEQLGYHVRAYNYRTKIQEFGILAMWRDFRALLKDKKFDLIVFCKTNQMDPELLEYAKKAGPTWYWFMDPLATAEAVMASEFAKHATYASATASNVVETFKAKNENSFHIIEGYDPDIYYYEEVEKIYDVVFIGNYTPQRAIDIEALEVNNEICVHIFGGGWRPDHFKVYDPVYNEEERRVINQSRIVLNLCQDDTIFSDRIVKSLACGASLLSQNCKDLRLFPVGPGTYETVQQAMDIINLQLNEAQEFLANEISKEIAYEISNHYSWKAVCEKILEKVK